MVETIGDPRLCCLCGKNKKKNLHYHYHVENGVYYIGETPVGHLFIKKPGNNCVCRTCRDEAIEFANKPRKKRKEHEEQIPEPFPKKSKFNINEFKYGIIEFAYLEELLDIILSGCEHNKKWNKFKVTVEKDIPIAYLKCSLGCIHSISLVKKSTSAISELAISLVSASYMCSIQPIQLQNLLETIKCTNITRYDKNVVTQNFQPVVDNELNEELQNVQKQLNSAKRLKNEVVLELDEQHSRSQRTRGVAPFASTVIIDSFSNLIVGYGHADKDIATKHDCKDKAKASRQEALAAVAQKLKRIDCLVVDGSTSVENSVDSCVRKFKKHKHVRVQKDQWHKTNIIGKAWKLIHASRIRKYGAYKFPKLVDLAANKLKLHWTFCAKECKNSALKFTRLWRGAFIYWVRKYKIKKTDAEYKMLKDFLEQYVESIPDYVENRRTFLTESFHNIAARFCPKAGNWKFTGYCLRKNIAALCWNNTQRKNSHWMVYKQELISKMIEKMQI